MLLIRRNDHGGGQRWSRDIRIDFIQRRKGNGTWELRICICLAEKKNTDVEIIYCQSFEKPLQN